MNHCPVRSYKKSKVGPQDVAATEVYCCTGVGAVGYRQLRDFLHCWEGLAPKGRGVCTYIRIGVWVPCAIRKLNTYV